MCYGIVTVAHHYSTNISDVTVHFMALFYLGVWSEYSCCTTQELQTADVDMCAFKMIWLLFNVPLKLVKHFQVNSEEYLKAGLQISVCLKKIKGFKLERSLAAGSKTAGLI